MPRSSGGQRGRAGAVGRGDGASGRRDHAQLRKAVEPSLGHEVLGRLHILLRRFEVPALEVDAGKHRERTDLDQLRPVERVGERGSRGLAVPAPPGCPAERPRCERPPRTVALGPPGAAGERQPLADVVPRQRGSGENAGAYDGRPEADRGCGERQIEPPLALLAPAVEPQQPPTCEREARVVASLGKTLEPVQHLRLPSAVGDALPDRRDGLAGGSGVAAREQVLDGLLFPAGRTLGGRGAPMQPGREGPVAPLQLGGKDPPGSRLEPVSTVVAASLDEQVAALEVRQHRCRAVTLQKGVADRW